MKIDLIKLIYNQTKEIEIKGSFKLSKEYWGVTDIVDLKEIDVFGSINKTASDELELNLELKGVMALRDSRTLKEISYPYNTEIKQIIKENDQIQQNALDIEPILWENVLLEVPIRIVSDESPIDLKGEGWELKDN